MVFPDFRVSDVFFRPPQDIPRTDHLSLRSPLFRGKVFSRGPEDGQPHDRASASGSGNKPRDYSRMPDIVFRFPKKRTDSK